ncbi:unnamed protein product [Symbiodinium natans]|uniref:RING-type domain-containing protein n=1 Tax=Symbiodinium natans TaxID=878477 RepID=A0A812RP76_9DINO|nr:unnamed protein product [Symbiodinium natans]
MVAVTLLLGGVKLQGTEVDGHFLVPAESFWAAGGVVERPIPHGASAQPIQQSVAQSQPATTQQASYPTAGACAADSSCGQLFRPSLPLVQFAQCLDRRLSWLSRCPSFSHRGCTIAAVLLADTQAWTRIGLIESVPARSWPLAPLGRRGRVGGCRLGHLLVVHLQADWWIRFVISVCRFEDVHSSPVHTILGRTGRRRLGAAAGRVLSSWGLIAVACRVCSLRLAHGFQEAFGAALIFEVRAPSGSHLTRAHHGLHGTKGQKVCTAWMARRISRADTPDRCRRQPSPVLSVASRSPPPSSSGSATPRAPEAELDSCCVCLEALQPSVSGERAPRPFPTCARHQLHLGCLAQFRAQASRPADLLCPLCRHSRCPACEPEGWTARHDAALRDECARQGVQMPARRSGEETVREAVQDYALRTFTSNDAPEPPPPPGVVVLCCNRVAATRGAGGVNFVALPHRDMDWAPQPIRHEAGIAAWRPAWLCPGCARDVQLDDIHVPANAGQTCGGCGSRLWWEYDRAIERGRLRCSHGCNRPAEELRAPEPVRPAPPALPHVSGRGGGSAFWLSRGPPTGDVRESTNSWLYVPLLHAAAADLAVAALAEWRADRRAASWWEEARHVLMASEPVSPQTLVAAVVRAVEAAPTHEHHLPDLVSRIQDAGLPSSARVHVGWAVRQLREPDAYLLAPVQEALLECYGGMQLASALDRHSDRFRAMPAPGAAPPHGEAAETSARGGRGRRRGRGRGVPPASGARQRDHDSSGSDTAAAPVPDHAQVPDRQPVSLPDFPRAAWQWLDGLDLLAELRRQVPTLHTVPRFLAAGVRHALVSALQAIRVAHEGRDDVACVRAWKLFLLLPRLLLARCVETGGEGRAVLLRRVQLFREGRWDSLHGQLGAVPSRTRQPTTPDASEARAAAACARVRRGELSRARQVLTAAALAPGDEATLRALTDPSRRPPQPLRPVPQHVMNHHPAEEVALSKQQVADALRTSKRGSAAGLSGATVEFYKLLLDDEGALEAFTFVVNVAARAQAPPVALDALALSRLTALRKPQGGVRGPGEEAAWIAARLGAFLPPSLGGLGLLAAERECQRFVRQLLRLRVQRAPATLRATAAQGWARRWWGLLSVAVQRAVASTALGVWTMPALPGSPDGAPLADVLELADFAGPSRLPLR